MWVEKFDRADLIEVGNQMTVQGDWWEVTQILPTPDVADYLDFHLLGAPTPMLTYKVNRRVPYRVEETSEPG